MDKLNSEVVSISLYSYNLTWHQFMQLFHFMAADDKPHPSTIPLSRIPSPSTVKPITGVCHLEMIFSQSYNSLALPVQQSAEWQLSRDLLHLSRTT